MQVRRRFGLDFELRYEKEIRTKRDGLEVYYSYKFDGLDASNKSTLVFRTEKLLGLEPGAIVELPAGFFSNRQNKLKKK